MKPRPSTTSPLPSAVTAPRRISEPIATSATSPTRIGTPSLAVIDDALDLLDVRRAAEALHEHRLRAFADIAAADVAIVLFDGLHHLVERQAVLDEQVRIDAHLVLLLVAAPAVDLRRALARCASWA